ncbi:MAG: hypothetical protein EBU46_00785 [Nitrosomonadaceae bacterium]|nr:hypothetical protein [Nitrosomonadaceae bacterium]
MNTKIDKIFGLPVPAHTRGWFDPEKTRTWLKEYAVEGFNNALNKLETNDFKLKVKNVHVVEPEHPYTYKEQKQAVLDKRDLSMPIKGTVQLINKKTDTVVDEKHTTLAQLPWLTERNTAIINGSEYIISAQQRLKSGIYTRIKESGEAEAHVNVTPGSGMGGKIIFYPDRALFVYQVGTSQIKLYGLLKDLGVSDATMEQAWGKEIFQRNKQLSDGNELEKFYSKIFSNEVENPVHAAAHAAAEHL